MSLAEQLQSYFYQSPLTFMKTVLFESIVFDQRAQYMCKFGCKNYNRKYSCPPASLSTYRRIRNKKSHRWATLFATTCEIPENYSFFRAKFFNNQKEMEIQKIVSELDVILDTNNVDHLSLSGGSCQKCKECSFIYNEACKKPHFKYASMEAVQIDCQKTMHSAGFDFQMPNNGSVNRCGCILTNEDGLSKIELKKRESLQKLSTPSKEKAIEMCSRIVEEYPKLFQEVYLIPISKLEAREPLCNEECESYGRNFSCPLFSEKIRLDLWQNAIIWKWNENKYKKYRYNISLKTIHSAFFSLGYYFALTLRDCYCDECDSCSFLPNERSLCSYRKILAPSMQSQGISPDSLGSGKFGIELI
jgi:predicted metal-binding protein